jgi:two-component system, cell cycle response regulator
VESQPSSYLTDAIRDELKKIRAAQVRGDSVEQIPMLLSLCETSADLTDTRLQLEVKLLLGIGYANARNHDACLDVATSLSESAARFALTDIEAVALSLMGFVYACKDQPRDAFRCTARALQLNDNSMPFERQLMLINGAGLTHMMLGLVRQASGFFRQAVELAANAKDQPNLCLFYRVNLLNCLHDWYELVCPIEPQAATKVLTEIRAETEVFLRKANEIGTQTLLDEARHYKVLCELRSGVLDDLSGFGATAGGGEEVSNVEHNLIYQIMRSQALFNLGLTTRARLHAEQANVLYGQRSNQLRFSWERIAPMKIAQLLGDHKKALELQQKFFCWIIRNEYISYDERVAELNATVNAQSMQLKVAILEHKNEGLNKTFKTLRDQAYTDSLTHTLNRRGIEAEFSRRASTYIPFCIALIDIDFFKQINDTHSHLVGDQVLIQVARILEKSLRVDDVLGRYGGEEFLAYIAVPTLTEAAVIGERLRASVEEFKFELSSSTISVTVSIGVAEIGAKDDFNEAVRRADTQLYAAKNAGRNCLR